MQDVAFDQKAGVAIKFVFVLGNVIEVFV